MLLYSVCFVNCLALYIIKIKEYKIHIYTTGKVLSYFACVKEFNG